MISWLFETCGNNAPVIIADMMCMSHTTKAIPNDEKALPSIPNIKAGPALLQNPNNRAASFLLIFPFAKDSAISLAPTGYPPKSPVNIILSQPDGILQILHNCVNIGMRTFLKIFNNAELSTIKGNREGINVFIHNSIPSDAPNNAVVGNKTNIAIANIKSKILRAILRVKQVPPLVEYI